MSTARDALKGAILGTLLLAGYAIAGTAFPPQGSGGGGVSFSTGDLAEVLGNGATTGGTDMTVSDGDFVYLEAGSASGLARGGYWTSDILTTTAMRGGFVLRAQDATVTNDAGGALSLTGGTGDGTGVGGNVQLVPGSGATDGEVMIAAADDLTKDVHLAVTANGVLDLNNEIAGGGDAQLNIGKSVTSDGTSKFDVFKTTAGTILLTASNDLIRTQWEQNAFRMNSAGVLSWNNATNTPATGTDTWLERGAAGQLDVNSSAGGSGNGTLKASRVIAGAGTAGAPAISIGSTSDDGLYELFGGVGFSAGGAQRGYINANGMQVSGQFYTAGGNVIFGASEDARLQRSAAGVLDVNATASGGGDGVLRVSTIRPGPTITLTDAATVLFTVALPAGTRAGGTADIMLEATDGTDHQVRVETIRWACVNKASAYSTQVTTISNAEDATAMSAGTLTATYDVTTGTDLVNFRVTPTGSLTETTYQARVVVHNLSDQAITYP